MTANALFSSWTENRQIKTLESSKGWLSDRDKTSESQQSEIFNWTVTVLWTKLMKQLQMLELIN